ncbi:MAG: AAA family ATPase [Gammaproteobacteria bacterium]
MYPRILKIDQKLDSSVIVFGPRGVGKTQWLKRNFSDALYFDLLHDDTFNELLARASRLPDKIPESYVGWVVIDEVQKIPELLNEVHRLIEQLKSLREII